MDIEVLKQQLIEDEGCKYEIYLDHLGYKTFGIGHLCRAKDPENDMDVGTEVSKERVDECFAEDIERVKALSDISNLFYISGAGIVGAYMGTTAWMSRK